MKKFLGLIMIIGLGAWLYFLTNNIIFTKSPDYKSFFSTEDSIVVCIHQISEFDWEEDDFQTIESNKLLLSEFSNKLKTNHSFFISTKRSVIVIENREVWSENLVNKLFNRGQAKLNFTGNKTFRYGKYSGSYSNNQLIIFLNDLSPKSDDKINFEIDKQASFSVVFLKTKSVIVQDFYKKSDCKIIHEYGKSKLTKNNLIDDKLLFSNFIPKDFDCYSFFEKEYLKYNDPHFKNSPLANYVETGLVELKFKGNKLLIFDYPGESAIDAISKNINNEKIEKYTLIKGISIKQGFLDSKNGYFFFELDGYVYLSSNKDFLESALKEIESSNSLANNASKQDSINKYLPKAVSFRSLTQEKQEALSYFGGEYLKSTVVFHPNGLIYNDSLVKNYFSMDPGVDIVSYCALSGRGNALVYTKNQELIGYINGIRQWSKNEREMLLSPPKILENSEKGREIVSLRFKDTIKIITKMGRITNYFIGSFITDPIGFILNNKPVKLFTTSNSLRCYDEKTILISNYLSPEKITAISVYYEGKKPIASILTAAYVQHIDLSNNRIISKTKLPENISNRKLVESGALIFTENQLYMLIDSKGIKTKLNIDQTWSLASHFTNQNIPHLLFANLNQCLLMKNNGAIQWKKTWPIRGLSAVTVAKINSAVLFTVYDNIENNLYLYDVVGTALDQVNRPANATGHTTAFGENGQSITTLLGNVLIQYTKY